METARGGRIYFAFTLIQITRQVRQHFVAHVRSINDVLAEQAFRIALGGKRRTEDSKMADQADDLGIPTTPPTRWCRRRVCLICSASAANRRALPHH